MQVFEVPGKERNDFKSCTATIYEDFMLLAAHVDDSLALKIANGEYVNSAKLIQKNRLNQEDDNRLEMVNKGGSTY